MWEHRNPSLIRCIVAVVLASGSQLCAQSSPPASFTTITSGPEKVYLVELFTSEGCSSCPPADRYLSSFKESELLWARVVPVALHVDYWDRLGWRDPFASPINSLRQRIYAAAGSGRVYTPGFFIDGREWRGFFQREAPPLEDAQAGILSGRLNEDGTLVVSFVPFRDNLEDVVVTATWLIMDATVRVEHGENARRELSHQFIAHRIVEDGLMKTPNGFSGKVDLGQIPDTAYGNVEAVAFWVRANGDQAALQAAGDFVHELLPDQ